MNLFTTIFLLLCISWANLSRGNTTDTETILLKNIDTEKISEAIELIESKFQEHLPDGDAEKNFYNQVSHIRWYSGDVPSLLKQTFNYFLTHEKIYALTGQIKEKLKSDSKYCTTQNNSQYCFRIEAFYIPSLDVIFIDDDLDNEKFASLLFHEFIHAYQYRYSFPLDWTTLIKQKSNSKDTISQEELLNLLIFRYEAQANWYQTTLFRTKEWFNLENPGIQITTGVFKIAFGMALALVSVNFLNPDKLQKNQTDQILPYEVSIGSHNIRFDTNNPTFTIPEIFLIDDWFLNLGSNLNISIHKKFYNLLGRAYFGKLPFVVDKRIQNTYKALIGNYYKNLVINNWTSNPNYQNLLTQINDPEISPFMKWLTLDDAYFEDTPIFHDFLHNRAEIIDLLMKNPSGFFQFDARSAVINTGSNQSREQTVINESNNKSKLIANLILSNPSTSNNKKISKEELNTSLVQIILQGGEGSTPGLDFTLQAIPIFIQPQLEFTKKSIEQDFEPESKPSHFEQIREEK